ncbi:MAG: MlaA family lipoprotein [Fusobacteriaceae bacterium]
MKTKKYLVMLMILLSTYGYGAEELNLKVEDNQKNGAQYFEVYDPWEGMNRRVYQFNYYFDRYFFLPVVESYRFVTPDFVEGRVTDFFGNLNQGSVMINSLAQGKGRKFMRSLGRFSMNSILGVLGFFDVATELEMPKEYEDLGLTLAHYGVSDGPYLILPILGPSNLRDGAGTFITLLAAKQIIPYNYIEGVDTTHPLSRGMEGIETRRKNSFRYYETGSPFEYEYLRFFYREFRDLQIEGN